MEFREFLLTMQMAGATLTSEQISELGAEAHERFGIDKDIFMLLLLSGREDFKNWIYEQASRKLEKDLRSEYVQTAESEKRETVLNEWLAGFQGKMQAAHGTHGESRP